MRFRAASAGGHYLLYQFAEALIGANDRLLLLDRANQLGDLPKGLSRRPAPERAAATLSNDQLVGGVPPR